MPSKTASSITSSILRHRRSKKKEGKLKDDTPPEESNEEQPQPLEVSFSSQHSVQSMSSHRSNRSSRSSKSKTRKDNPDVDNDEAIAIALAKADQELADAEFAQRLEAQDLNGMPPTAPAYDPSSYPAQNRPSTTTPAPDARSPTSETRVSTRTINCPNGCGLTPFQASRAQMVRCNECNQRIRAGEQVYGCPACDYDVCQTCLHRSRAAAADNGGGGSGNERVVVQGTPVPSPYPRQPPPATTPTPFPFPSTTLVEQNPMCMVPCIIGEGICVEMLVDSGAQISVISLPLAQQLHLSDRIDTSHSGVAAGVGQARITGRIHHVLCTLGNVEFEMDFMVLETSEKMLLLGLDQMRKYKCIIDLESETLVFGGKGGVEVPMLPPATVPRWKQDMMGQVGCPVS